MADEQQTRVVQILNEQRDELLYHVTDALVQRMPQLGLPTKSSDRSERHHTNMESTARRFHEIVEAGVTVDWNLVAFEFDWAGRKLGSMEITWQHQELLIDTYFQEALRLRDWTDSERAALEQIAEHLRDTARAAYQEHASTP
jgi:hypothetical protein